VWHHLEPWDDAVVGLTRLAARHVVGPLSNGGFAMLTRMAKRAGLPWDCIISTELFRSFKPDPAAYLGGAALLGLDPGRVALVAAHSGDLRAASQAGLRTAYVPRPAEWGPDAPAPEAPDPSFDVVAPDFSSLAATLGC
jgi:2-haloacid dehalogenase